MQRKGAKCVPTEDDIIQSNKISFGDAIGSTTNIITSQICLQARFPKESEEYKVLEYRILCGQHYQQTTIDRTKGIIADPMPRYWYDNSANKILEDDPDEVKEEKLFNQRICADKKPYFFIYNYPTLLKEYKDYVKDADKNAYREYGVYLDELLSLENPTKKQKEFIEYYHRLYPVNNETCIVNEICWVVEKAFENPKKVNAEFDYTILKSSATYTPQQKRLIEFVYDEYLTEMRAVIKENPYISVDNVSLAKQFKIKCLTFVPDEKKICNILLDAAYNSNRAKGFIWDAFGDVLIDNLLDSTNGYCTIPVECPGGEIDYCGKTYTMTKVKIRKDEE